MGAAVTVPAGARATSWPGSGRSRTTTGPASSSATSARGSRAARPSAAPSSRPRARTRSGRASSIPTKFLAAQLEEIEGQSKLRGDLVPALCPTLGVIAIPSAFGGEVVWWENDFPAVRPARRRSTSRTLRGLEQPRITDGELRRILDDDARLPRADRGPDAHPPRRHPGAARQRRAHHGPHGLPRGPDHGAARGPSRSST